jgi:hypothetical protein
MPLYPASDAFANIEQVTADTRHPNGGNEISFNIQPKEIRIGHKQDQGGYY